MKPSRVIPHLPILLSFLVAMTAFGDLPKQHVAVTYDPDARHLTGTIELEFETAGPSLYFALLPNLAAERNPYVSPRAIDAVYPRGFDSSGIDIWAVQHVQSEGATSLSFRLLSMPPARQIYGLDESVLAVDLPSDFTGGTIRVAFRTRIPRVSFGDEGLTLGILTWRFGWHPVFLGDSARLIELNGVVAYRDEETFPYVFPRARMTATVTVPDGYQALSAHLSGGATPPQADHPEEGADDEAPKALPRVYQWTFTEPARSIGLIVAQDDVYETYRLDGAPAIRVAYLAGHEEEARLIASLARDLLSEFGNRFGPYTEEGLTIVENPNTNGTAFAAEGIVWLSTRFFTHRNVLLPGIGNRILEFILAHEIAHQWFGLEAEVDLDAAAWLSEGLSQYAAVSTFEARYGATDGNLFRPTGKGLLEDLVSRQFGFYNLREHQIELPYLLNVWAGFDEAVAKPLADVQYGNANTVRIYDKGYLAARAIASAVGDASFDAGLALALEQAAGERLTIRGVQEALETLSGLALDGPFDAWVFGETSADYAVKQISSQRTGAGYETLVEVSRVGGTAQPVEVEAVLVSEATLRQTWNGENETATLIFHTPSPVARVTIDPEHRLPDRDRLNNHDPVKVVGSSNEAVLPLDAYVLSPDSASGGFTFSRPGRFRISLNASGISALVLDDHRNEYAAALILNEGQLTGRLAFTTTAYAQPATGSAAGIWEPDWRLTVSARRMVTAGGPLTVLGVAAIDLPSITATRSAALSLDWTTTNAGRLTMAVVDEVRLAPGVYLQGTGAIGLGFGALPDAMQHRFDELHAVDPGASNHKLSGRLTLELPPIEDEPFNLLNLAMLDRQQTRLFLAGGAGWTTLGDFSTTSHRLEAGIEQELDLSTLGGLLTFSARIGVAAPVEGEGQPVLYVLISL